MAGDDTFLAEATAAAGGRDDEAEPPSSGAPSLVGDCGSTLELSGGIIAASTSVLVESTAAGFLSDDGEDDSLDDAPDIEQPSLQWLALSW